MMKKIFLWLGTALVKTISICSNRRVICRQEELPADDMKWEDAPQELRQWILAACAINRKALGLDPHKLGGFAGRTLWGRCWTRSGLADMWDIYSRRDLIETIQDMIEDKLVWQALRVLQLAGTGYVAGYLTMREALNVSVAAGLRLQKLTRSWEGLAKAYLRSYDQQMDNDWGLEERQEAYVRLKAANDIYTVPFDMKLEKSW